MAIQIIYVANDNILELQGLKNAVTGSWENSAIVSVTLKDDAGNDVAGETWPMTMAYVAASNGNYRATLKDTLTLSADKTYTAHIDANAGVDLQGHWETPVTAKTRT